MLDKLYKYRFELFLTSQIAILFGPLVMPSNLTDYVSPILFYLNILAGSLFIVNNKKYHPWVVASILIIIGGIFMYSDFNEKYANVFNYLKLGIMFIFYAIVTLQLIKQIWFATLVNKKVIFGMMSGYISLGFIGFFIFTSIIIVSPDSFAGLHEFEATTNTLTQRLMYFSYITLMTIGYGEITPVTHLAQKATILIGLMGQFYLVIITAIVIGKYLNKSNNE